MCRETSLPLLPHTQHVAALLCSRVLWLGLRNRNGGGVSSITNNKHCLLSVMCNCRKTRALYEKKRQQLKILLHLQQQPKKKDKSIWLFVMTPANNSHYLVCVSTNHPVFFKKWNKKKLKYSLKKNSSILFVRSNKIVLQNYYSIGFSSL